MRNRRLRNVLLVATIAAAQLLTTVALGQSAPATAERKTSTPYAGDLSIFETPGREERLHIEEVMDLLSIGPGKTVADIGAGSGWFTVLAARRVSNKGTVYAVDINPSAITYIDERVAKQGLHNVKTVLGTADDPKLPANSIDAVLLLKTYHEVAKPVDLLGNLRTALRPQARVAVIDRNGNGEDHGITKEVVIREASQAGYRLVGEHDSLVKADKMDYFLIFETRQ